jgi:glycosyltransferase involved in cell wall biosynthesis
VRAKAPIEHLLIASGFADSLVNFRGDFIRALLARGVSVHAAAPDLDESTTAGRTLAEWGAVPHRIALSRTGLNPAVDLRTSLELFQLCQRLRPSHFLGYTPKPIIYGLLAARLARVPHRAALVTGLGYAFTSAQRSAQRAALAMLLRQLYGLSLRGAERVIFQNEDDRDLFLQLGLVRLAQCGVIDGSGVNLSTFGVAPLPTIDGDIRFLLIARLLRDKGIYEFIEAARSIRREHPRACFELVGYHDTNPASIAGSDLESWIREGIVTFHGRLDDVRPALASCHVYVLPSYREGTPRTVLEAMAMGRAIITSDAPGCRQTVVPGRNGFLVPPRDAAGLADAMRRFLEEPELIQRFGAASREVARERFDVQKVNERLIGYLEMGG